MTLGIGAPSCSVTSTITPIESGQYIGLALTGNFHAFGWANHGGIDPATQAYWWQSQSSARVGELALNFGRFRDPAIDEALVTLRTNADPAARKDAAKRLDKAVNSELKGLKLDKAKFRTELARLSEEHWGEAGVDAVVFQIATNPGAPFSPLARIASGGELARLMLAVTVCLARANPVPSLVFDEVDAGVGGATAAAVGERLQRLADGLQVLVVTHSPQVAAVGRQHWRVLKETVAGSARTRLLALDATARREEIARMLSAAEVTAEARAQRSGTDGSARSARIAAAAARRS